MPRRWRVLALFVLTLGTSGCRGEPSHGDDAAPASGVQAVAAGGLKPPGAVTCDPSCWNIERCVEGRCVPACPEGEVYVPATGANGFLMGRDEPSTRDQQHRVVLTRPFCMDATEVTVAAFRGCVEAGGCEPPWLKDINANYRPEYDRPNHPVNLVDFRHARTYCAYRGQALPTEAQWEWAASGGDGRTWPWGNEPEPSCANEYADFTPGGAPKSTPAGDVGCRGGGTSEVRSHPKGKVSWPDGEIHDLAGNVWEWTADCFLPYPAEPQVDPSPQEHPLLNGACWVRSIRGGGWNRSMTSLRTFARAGAKRPYKVPGLGFRCVRNAERTPRPEPPR
jgi:formylglycine-generating enzyme required for sulfatase activity